MHLVEACAARELVFEELPHRAAEIHLIGQFDAKLARHARGPAAGANELREGQQLVLVREVIARPVPVETDRR